MHVFYTVFRSQLIYRNKLYIIIDFYFHNANVSVIIASRSLTTDSWILMNTRSNNPMLINYIKKIQLSMSF